MERAVSSGLAERMADACYRQNKGVEFSEDQRERVDAAVDRAFRREPDR